MNGSSPANPSAVSSHWVVQYMRSHPILSYFLLAFGFTWAYLLCYHTYMMISFQREGLSIWTSL